MSARRPKKTQFGSAKALAMKFSPGERLLRSGACWTLETAVVADEIAKAMKFYAKVGGQRSEAFREYARLKAGCHEFVRAHYEERMKRGKFDGDARLGPDPHEEKTTIGMRYPVWQLPPGYDR